ncbi:PaaI family thioesterase [Stigmatella sp. ncwal1]|uniref:PaaI family thioesterase n=1 Tax=Stigmatella ashevillensis TaxID=2995309 RepID=A0ABT5DKL0_9BACT|nr:PaaI family thioesterase [Stigmatella ashevillena]MDC0714066.1 PaaI family thioesterase [Stigmatella ashevillena]
MSAPPTRPTQEQLDRYAEQFTQSQTLRHLGVRLSFPEGRKVLISLPEVRPEHLGGLGTTAVNGAVLSAMFDLAIGCTPALLDPTRRCATLQLSLSFQRPLVGSSLEAEAEIDSHGKSTLFASARIRDAQGNICARAQGVVRISTLPWASGESPAIN